jgi:membrane associated rhomboid family serine protease
MPPETFYGMQEPLPVVTICLIAATVIVSIAGFRNRAVEDRLIFCPENIMRDKQGYRLVTSAFLHQNWPHLIFNMYSLYAFGRWIELRVGVGALLAIYFASVIGGSLLSLFIHRHHVYKAYGASGGVCGIIFAYIFLFPGSGIYILFVPAPIPAWAYAIAYLLYSFYGLKSARDNIGHDAHLGGAIIGLLTTTAMYPGIVGASPKLYAAVMLISLGIFVYLLRNPLFLPLNSFAPDRPATRPPPRRPEKKPLDINAILDKISKSGMQSLTKAEHEALMKASRGKRPKDEGGEESSSG